MSYKKDFLSNFVDFLSLILSSCFFLCWGYYRKVLKSCIGDLMPWSIKETSYKEVVAHTSSHRLRVHFSEVIFPIIFFRVGDESIQLTNDKKGKGIKISGSCAWLRTCGRTWGPSEQLGISVSFLLCTSVHWRSPLWSPTSTYAHE